jgi:hypothetical protein
MGTSTRARFAHRFRKGASPVVPYLIDSVCLKCFQTIASTQDIAELESLESVHICNGLDLFNALHPENSSRSSDK